MLLAFLYTHNTLQHLISPTQHRLPFIIIIGVLLTVLLQDYRVIVWVLCENNPISNISIAIFQIRKLILRINNLIKISELIKSRGSTQLRVYWKPNPCFEPLCKNQYSSLRAWLSLPVDYQPSEGKDPVEFIFIDILCLIKYLLETQ